VQLPKAVEVLSSKAFPVCDGETDVINDNIKATITTADNSGGGIEGSTLVFASPRYGFNLQYTNVLGMLREEL